MYQSQDSIKSVKIEENPYNNDTNVKKEATVFHESFGNTDSLKIVHEDPPSDSYNPKPNSAMYIKGGRRLMPSAT